MLNRPIKISAITPANKKPPMLVKSFLVKYPQPAKAPKLTVVINRLCTILAAVNTEKIKLKLTPKLTANAQKLYFSCAVVS